MKGCALLLFGLALLAAPAFSQNESEIRNRIVATWKLVSTQETVKDGTTRPFPSFGPRGKGFLMYQRDGYMCADLVNPDRPQWADPVHTTAEEKVAAADGSFAYCGRYEIDVKQKWIVHLPEVATDPGYVGSRQIRPYRAVLRLPVVRRLSLRLTLTGMAIIGFMRGSTDVLPGSGKDSSLLFGWLAGLSPHMLS